MALFLRGNMWWFEYRTKRVRIVRSTGFKREDKQKAKAAFEAFRLGVVARPVRSAMEKILSAIYDSGEPVRQGVPLASVWTLYEDWFKGKAKSVVHTTWTNRRSAVSRFVEWAQPRGLSDIGDVSVDAARQYVKHLVAGGDSNKTVRNKTLDLSCVWQAIGQLRSDVHNPWRAACPDKDGSAEVGEAFSPEQEAAVLAAARKLGCGWYEASMIARFTGQRYGDVATLDWSQVDFKAGVVRFRPIKTKRVGFAVSVPMHSKLREVLQSLAGKGSGRSRATPVGFVLPGHGLAYSTKRRMPVPFSDVLREARLDPDKFTFHSWRHTFRTRLGEAGVPDEVAARFGWTNLAMSRHYDHAGHEAEMREAVSRLG